MRLTIDRIEGDFAVAIDEIGAKTMIELQFLPENVHESDVIDEKDGAYVINTEETEKRRAENVMKLKQLLARGKRE